MEHASATRVISGQRNFMAGFYNGVRLPVKKIDNKSKQKLLPLLLFWTIML
jgi:hypothetical protein